MNATGTSAFSSSDSGWRLARGGADRAMVDQTGAWFIWFTSAGYEMFGPIELGVSGTPVAADFDSE